MKKIWMFLLATVCCYLLKAQSVGIGTSTPAASAQLDVASTAKGLLIPRMTAAQRTAITSPANGLMVYETTTSSFWFYNGAAWSQIGTGGASSWTVNGNNIYNSNTGNVGIGTTIGIREKLSVKGNMFVTHVNPNDLVNGGNKAVLNLHGANTGSGVVNFLEPDTTVAASITYGTLLNSFVLKNGNNGNQLFLHNNGNVGIGISNISTTTPQEKLDVFGVIRSRDTIIADDDIEAGNRIRAGGSITGDGLISNGSLYVTGTSLLEGNITAIGNINSLGTGTFTGNINSNTSMSITDAAGILNFISGTTNKGFVQMNGDDLRIGCNSSNLNGKFVVRTTAGDKFFIDNAGYAGINVTGLGALSQLHIGSGADANLTNNGYFMMGYPNGSNLIMDNNEIMARNNGAAGNLVLQNDGGTVRIGSTPVPNGYKFAINGKMICEELRIKLASTWPDYVFKNDYKLLPLTALENFIANNKHLPNIPAAAVVEKEGIAVGDMQKKMMEKIEELTLYIIDLQKQIDTLKKKTSGN